MDVNDTKFHLLCGREDWRVDDASASNELKWEESCGSIRLKNSLFHFPVSTTLLFCWDDIPGKDNEKLLEFLIRTFRISWAKSAKIEIGDDPNIIKVYDINKVILLILNEKKNELKIEINNILSHKLIVKNENGRLNIYSRSERLLTPSDRRGADIDRYGNIYWIASDNREIRIFNSGSRTSSHFWAWDDLDGKCEKADFVDEKKEERKDLSFSGLVVTENHYLVTGFVGGFLIFDLLSGGSPVRVIWNKTDDFSPFDMAKVPGGGVLILDKDHKICHLLDRNMRLGLCSKEIKQPDVADFKPETNNEGKIKSYQKIETSYSIKAKNPISIEAISEDSFAILDSDPNIEYSRILVYEKGKIIKIFKLKGILEKYIKKIPDSNQSFHILGHDIAFVPDTDYTQISGMLYLAGNDGNQAYAFHIEKKEDGIHIELVTQYYPMRLFSGKALISDGKNVLYDLKEKWLRIIQQEVPLFSKKGWLITRILDGKNIGCVWHRVLLDAYIPEGATVKMESKSADEESDLSFIEWQEEPRFYLREKGSEIPYYSFPGRQKIKGQGTWELLIQRAVGRYLILRLTIEGTGGVSPVLYALRVYYPRFSYMKKYLPSVYQDDIVSASFLDRYLANIEGFYTEIEGKIENVQTLFDIGTIPPEYIDWLADWFGIILNSHWEDFRKRLFISNAVSLFRERGTISGLLRMIRLAVDECPNESIFKTDPTEAIRARGSVRIVEKYLLRKAPGVVYGDPEDSEGPGVTSDISRWKPDDGAPYIHILFRKFLEEHYGTIEKLNAAWGTQFAKFEIIKFPPVLPPEQVRAKDWRFFVKNRLGLMYAEVSSDHENLYRNFLKKRYRKLEEINRIYQEGWERFDDIKFPVSLPEDKDTLSNWMQFVSLVLPIRLNAHQFIVLVPEKQDENDEEKNRRMDLIKRIVETEKPAHTVFELKTYYSLFRIGEARLGFDTELGKGSRFMGFMLGKSRLEEGTLWCSPGEFQGRMYVWD